MSIERTSATDTLVEVLERVFDKGIVVDAWFRVSMLAISGVTILVARVVVPSPHVGPFDDSPRLDISAARGLRARPFTSTTVTPSSDTSKHYSPYSTGIRGFSVVEGACQRRGTVMPNGHSGGYVLSKAEFRALLDAFPSDEAIAQALRDDPDRPGNVQRSRELNVTAREVLALLDRHGRDDLSIEEQDGSWYIVHIDIPKREVFEDFRLHSSWLMVTQHSSLFTPLRALHRR
jgi:hypothetical protein